MGFFSPDTLRYLKIFYMRKTRPLQLYIGGTLAGMDYNYILMINVFADVKVSTSVKLCFNHKPRDHTI